MNKLLIAILGAIIVFLGGSTAVKLGGVAQGNTYSYATTTGSFANASSTMLRVGAGEIGSVVIGVTSATTFVLRDATSTTDIASTTILSLAASPAIGSSMLLDLSFTRGLFIEFPASFVGRYTITYR